MEAMLNLVTLNVASAQPVAVTETKRLVAVTMQSCSSQSSNAPEVIRVTRHDSPPEPTDAVQNLTSLS